MNRQKLTDFLVLTIIGLIGGGVALYLGAPMPFLLGGLALSACLTIAIYAQTGREVWYPQPLRRSFVAVIGVMIGASFSPAFMDVLLTLWLSMSVMLLFVVTAHALNYQILRRFGGYDRVTALFGGMPGGLVEAVTMGEAAGGDAKTLSVQHFARIVIVVVTVPLLFFLWSGQTVGSAAGQSLAVEGYGLADLGFVAVIAFVGLWLGPRIRLPAGHLMGPLLLSAIVHASGVYSLNSPVWLLSAAQLVVGVGLGALFAGATGRQLLRAFGFAAVMVSAMLMIAMGFALTLSQWTGLPIDALFISFAPGGVTEMGLIALSLGVSPVVVAAHHLVRIIMTVSVVNFVLKSPGFKKRP
ncbi:MAG: AbrB family transcriptional regulator [Pikeienuella sp.]